MTEISEKEIEAAMSGWHRALIDAPDESVYERRRRCIRAALEAALRVRADEKLPCDVQLPGVKLKRGVSLSTLLTAIRQRKDWPEEQTKLPRLAAAEKAFMDRVWPRLQNGCYRAHNSIPIEIKWLDFNEFVHDGLCAVFEASGTDYFGSLVERARAAATKASEKFPQPNYVTLKIAEEAGEVVRGAVHYAERRMEWSEVEGEIIQLLAMLIRFVTEGDQVNGIVPPTVGGGDE